MKLMIDPWQPGDLAACYGTDRPARIISWGTASLFGPPRLRLGPSHVAILCHPRGSAGGGLFWVESTTLTREPCQVHHMHRRGCQAHEPEARVAEYVAAGGRVDVYRLSPIDALSTEENGLLSEILLNHFVARGVRYDLGQALISGLRLLKRTRFFPAADLESVFCSELIAAVLMRLGRLGRGNPTRYNPATLLRELVRNGTYRFVGEAKPA